MLATHIEGCTTADEARRATKYLSDRRIKPAVGEVIVVNVPDGKFNGPS
jgi:hypothetical protein